MISFVALSLPIFGVVALGWIATRMNLSNQTVIDALGVFSFRFALPVLVLRLVASQPLKSSFNLTFYGGYLASGALLFVLAFGFSRLLMGRNVAFAGAHATTATVSNLGFLGPPLMLAFFGERGAGPLAMAILAEIMILLTVGGVLMGATHGGIGVRSLVLRGTVQNPIVMAIVIGAVLAATGFPLPAPVDRFLGFLGASAGPTALFALGGALALQKIDRKTAIAAGAIAVTKLVIYPALVWGILTYVFRAGTFWLEEGILIAALPPAGNIYVLAQRYEADQDAVSAAIVLSTLASVVTVPLAAWLVLG